MTEMLNGHDLTHLKLDRTREDVRALHPILQLLDPAQEDLTSEFAEKLLGLLMGIQEQIREQTGVIEKQAKIISSLRQNLEHLQADMDFLVGEVPLEDGGS